MTNRIGVIEIQNIAPESDEIRIRIDGFLIDIWRDEQNEIHVHVDDEEEGSEMRMVLGREGHTHKL